MHKGRVYPLEQRARVYSAQVAYPYWWPAEFEMRVDGFFGSYQPSITDTVTIATYQDVDRDLGWFEYSGVLPSTGGKVVELVLESELSANHLDIISRFQVRVDGVNQIASPLTPIWLYRWGFAQRIAAASTPVGGAVAWWGGYIEAEAVPYP